MASGLKRYKKIELASLIVITIIFLLLSNKYIVNGLDSKFDFNEVFGNINKKVLSLTKSRDAVCQSGQIKIHVEDGDLCRNELSKEKEYEWVKIYDTYPRYADGKEIIYDFFDEGDIAIADAYLRNEIQIERYEPIKLDRITWEEDPYDERYWRFIFYSLRDTRHLLYAFRETGDDRYKNKLIEIVESFLDNGIDKPHSWDDYHAVAFRAMTLTNTWWKLRESNALTIDLSEKILKAIQRHGEFLVNKEHYENKYNHGISQATALLILGINFPDFDDSSDWVSVAEGRLFDGIKSLVDDDGILVENSPYYHFYALEKYWDIYRYFSKNDIDFNPKYKERINKMISYATYILQPNLQVPLLGASLERYVGNSGTFKEIAKENPEFLYVLTQGRKGIAPKELNKHYPTAGQVIMRSGWDKKTKFDNEFEKQTQVVFDVGPYRTDHSDLDALSFNLYSNGKTLITDTGLYTYEEDDILKPYFHGTKGHNTVLVDGNDQRSGVPVPGEFKEGDGYVFYSAQHDLYPQTYHQRSMILLGENLVVIVDRLISDREHDYEQLFHLFPGAKAKITDGISVVAMGDDDGTELTIRQLLAEKMSVSLPASDENKGQGFCSLEYEKTIPCQTVSYKKHAKNASFVTLLEIGNGKGNISAEIENENNIKIKTDNGLYNIGLNEADVDFVEKSKLREEVVNEYSLGLISEDGGWKLNGNENERFELEEDKNGYLTIVPKNLNNSGSQAVDFGQSTFKADVYGLDTYYSINQKLHLDIPAKNDSVSFNVYEQEDFLPILGYHHILSENQTIKSPTLEMYVSDFDEQIDYMTNVIGCRWFTFGDIMENYVLKGVKTPKKACVMNFDDGRKDHFVNGYQTFKKYGVVATFYIISERAFGNNSAYMDLSELDELYRNGNEIGSHTVSAGSLLTENYDKKGLTYQVEESKKMLESQGYTVATFAYPRGEQNEEIVALTSNYYMAGRDTEKDNLWRDRRPSTISYDEDYIWHMNYYKPELNTPEELGKIMGYNSWWQFEEGYRTDQDSDGDVRVLSSYDPTDNSYAVVDLNDVGDKISNKFIVSRDGTYDIEIFATVNTAGVPSYSTMDTMNIYVDDMQQIVKKGSMDKCVLYKDQYYCFYNVSVDLTEGSHSISVKANKKEVRLDKFRMSRKVEMKNYYDVKLTEQKKVLPDKYPEQISIDFEKQSFNLASVLKYFFSIAIMLTLGYILFLKYKNRK